MLVSAADSEASERSLLQVHPQRSAYRGKAHSFGGNAMGKAPFGAFFVANANGAAAEELA